MSLPISSRTPSRSRVPRTDPSLTTRPLWRWPLALAALSVSGLLSALVSDGLGDAWSWLALGVPVAVMAWFGWGPRRTGGAR